MKRVRTYIRYSDHKQDDGFSVEYQMSEIEEFLYRNGLELHKHHIDQATTATKVAGREAFFELVHDVKEGLVDIIVVYKLNRIFRNAYESQKYRKLFQKYGVKLMSVTQQIDEDTSAGRLMTNVLSDIDQYQSETISDHVKSSMREMARQGYFTGGTVPFGYTLDIIENGKKTRKKYIPDENESAVVKKIFELYADNYSLRYLQQYLTDNGYKTRQGKQFGLTTIARMLGNDFYIGTLRYSTQGYEDIIVENAVSPIIDADLWRKVQERKNANKQIAPRKRKRLYALTGKIYCGMCGNHFYGMQSGSTQNGKYYAYQYYVCSKRKDYQNCNCDRIRKDYIENTVLQEIKRRILNDDAIKRLATDIVALCANSPSELSAEKKNLLKRKKSLETQIDTLLEMRLAGEMSADILKKKSVVLEAELAETINNLFSIDERIKNSVTAESVEKYLRSMLQHAESTDDEILKNLYDNFVEKIVIDNERVDVSLIVRPFGRVAYKQSSGQPHVLLHANCKRE